MDHRILGRCPRLKAYTAPLALTYLFSVDSRYAERDIQPWVLSCSSEATRRLNPVKFQGSPSITIQPLEELDTENVAGRKAADLRHEKRTREVRTTNAESAIHEELSYSRAQFSKGNRPSPQSSLRKRGEARYCKQSSVLSRGARH